MGAGEIPKKTTAMIKEFKEFAFKGNLIDMAVGIIIGGAFSTVVKSLVDNVLMPPLGKIVANIDFSQLKFVLQDGVAATKEELSPDGKVITPAGEEVPEVAIYVGQFLQDLLSFLLMAVVVFIVVKKIIGSMQKQEEAKPAEPPKQEVLLTEIRDLLKERQG